MDTENCSVLNVDIHLFLNETLSVLCVPKEIYHKVETYSYLYLMCTVRTACH